MTFQVSSKFLPCTHAPRFENTHIHLSIYPPILPRTCVPLCGTAHAVLPFHVYEIHHTHLTDEQVSNGRPRRDESRPLVSRSILTASWGESGEREAGKDMRTFMPWTLDYVPLEVVHQTRSDIDPRRHHHRRRRRRLCSTFHARPSVTKPSRGCRVTNSYQSSETDRQQLRRTQSSVKRPPVGHRRRWVGIVIYTHIVGILSINTNKRRWPAKPC